MLINTIKDNMMILKDSIRTRVYHNSFQKESETVKTAKSVVRHLGLQNINNLIIAKPGTTLVIADKMVVRLPHNETNIKRCQINKEMLIKLKNTNIASFVPQSLDEGEYEGQKYFCESRIKGTAIDIPISKMDDMINKAAEFITKFHKETASDITINETNFNRLIGKDFQILSNYLNDGYELKLKQIEETLKKQLIGKQFKTVWMHGDYKVENILFDTKTWNISGIIDWDLSQEQGLPLLDIYYLLMYKQYTLTKKSVLEIYKDRFLNMNFDVKKQNIIDSHLSELTIQDEFIRPMLIMFWINHIVRRCASKLTSYTDSEEKWVSDNIYSIINQILVIK